MGLSIRNPSVNGGSYETDLDRAVELLRPIAEELRGARIFMTGGTGFVGCWLLETLAAMNEQLGLGIRITVQTRHQCEFAKKAPHLYSYSRLRDYRNGTMETFWLDPVQIGDDGKFDHIIHLSPGNGSRVMEMASRYCTKSVLLAGSGAVYGRRNTDDKDAMREDSTLAPSTRYGCNKMWDEIDFVNIGNARGFQVKIARMFAFVGPYLPLNKNFAIGNFISDALAVRTIRVIDGIPYRSYLYGMDMAVWLWTILIKGQNGRPYNVGSENAIQISNVACEVAKSVKEHAFPPIQIETPVMGPFGNPSEWYVPNVQRAHSELGLRQWTSLDQAIEKTLAWHRFQA